MDTTHPSARTAAYIAAIEDCFVAARGRGVQWAPEDCALAAGWSNEGVPIGLVCRVLAARVRAWRWRHGDDARMPMHLGWYAGAVIQAGRPLACAPGASQDGPSAGGDLVAAGAAPCLAELVDPLPGWIAAATHPAIAHAYRDACAALDRAQRPAHDRDTADPGTPEGGWPDPALVVKACRKRIRTLIVAGLTPAERAALDRAVEASVAPLAQRASKRVLAERQAEAQERWLSAELAVQFPSVDGWAPAGEEGA